jgi:hypothetical protein
MNQAKKELLTLIFFIFRSLKTFFLYLEIFYLLAKRLENKPGGLNLTWSCLDWDSRSWHWQKVSLDSQENLDNFKKLVLKYRYCLDTTFQSQKSRSRSRNMSRPEIFGKYWQCVSILIESELILAFI